jgi:hypothetical protein
VEALVAQHGPCTWEDITTHAPDITREQAVRALLSLRQQGRIILWQRGRNLGWPKGTEPSAYAIRDRSN